MSSLRNSLHRRNHKERSQLSHRARFGILEKHKDYVKRAQDYHSKKDRIKKLKEKAAVRNKDEFYFGMANQRTKGGVHIQDRGNRALPTDIVKVLKTQDENYIRAVRQAELKRIDKLKMQITALVDLVQSNMNNDDEKSLDEEDLSILRQAGILASPISKKRKTNRKSSENGHKHIIFVSNSDEAQMVESLAASKDVQTVQKDSDEEFELGWDWRDNKSSSHRQDSGQNQAESDEDEVLDMQAVNTDAHAYRKRLLQELAARLKRETNLRYAARELEMQRLMMGKGAARKIRGVEKVEGEEHDEDDEDALDARRGKRQKVDVGFEEATYRPRVYKWKAERKK